MPNKQRDAVAEAYARTAKNTVSGPMLVVKLYERLIVDIGTARENMDCDVATTHDALIHAQRIVRVLRTSLQPELFRGGAQLMELYETLEHALIKANLNKETGPLDVCEAIVVPLVEAWTEASRRYLSETVKESSDARSRWPEYLCSFAAYLDAVSADLQSGSATHLVSRPEAGPEGLVPVEWRAEASALLARASELAVIGESRRRQIAEALHALDQRTRVASRFSTVHEQL